MRLGLQRSVTFHGWVDDPGAWVAGASVQACPSRDEAFSQTAVLAMGLGVPVVGTNVDGFPETLADRRGIIVPAEDPQALAIALEQILAGHSRPDTAAARTWARQFETEPHRDRVRAGLLRTDHARSPQARRMTNPPTGPDADAWQILSPLLVRGGYLPWTTGSMRPTGLVEVCNEIVHGNRTRIVECGSGVSTVLLARLLQERGRGAITSLEHDSHWATLIQDNLRREHLDQIARVAHAPLQGNPPWYRLDEIPDEIDLLIVDGPPAFQPGHGAARAPALPRFDAKLVQNAAVILDDIDRPGEQQTITTWETCTSWRFELKLPAGVAIGQRRTKPPSR